MSIMQLQPVSTLDQCLSTVDRLDLQLRLSFMDSFYQLARLSQAAEMQLDLPPELPSSQLLDTIQKLLPPTK